MSDPVRPKGVELTITDTQQVIVSFDNGEIPDIIVSASSAEKLGSYINSASNRARKNQEL